MIVDEVNLNKEIMTWNEEGKKISTKIPEIYLHQ